jgi:protein CrcB
VPATRRAIQSRHRSAFPWGTFTVNVVGSFILGVLVAITDQLDPAVAAGVGIGFCGALTTYSTFSYETLRLLEKRAGSYAVANIVASVAAGFAAAGIGLALAPAPHRFSVGEFAAKVHARTGTSDAEYTIRQAAYDLRKLRGKQLVDKPARTRRHRVPALAARAIAALINLRHQVIAPILAGIRSPRMGRKPKAWTSIDRDYEQIRVNMQADPLRRPGPHDPGAASRLRT